MFNVLSSCSLQSFLKTVGHGLIIITALTVDINSMLYATVHRPKLRLHDCITYFYVRFIIVGKEFQSACLYRTSGCGCLRRTALAYLRFSII